MLTQSDEMMRVVALENLRAMCEHVSGVAHRYWIEKVTRSRVWVGYSNPDEYGKESPMFAIFPCYPSGFSQDGGENPRVNLDEAMRVIGDTWDGEGYQAFDSLRESPTLWREGERWYSHSEMRRAEMEPKADAESSECKSCNVCDLPKPEPISGVAAS